MNEHFAHTDGTAAKAGWQTLEDHLRAVADMACRFAPFESLESLAYLAGLYHDIGKYSREFQAYLAAAGGGDSHAGEIRARVDHSTAGAQRAVSEHEVVGHLVAFAIAGHHSGLLDSYADGACQKARLEKTIPPWRHGVISDYVGTIMGRTAIRIFNKFRHLKRKPYWGNHFWSK